MKLKFQLIFQLLSPFLLFLIIIFAVTYNFINSNNSPKSPKNTVYLPFNFNHSSPSIDLIDKNTIDPISNFEKSQTIFLVGNSVLHGSGEKTRTHLINEIASKSNYNVANFALDGGFLNESINLISYALIKHKTKFQNQGGIHIIIGYPLTNFNTKGEYHYLSNFPGRASIRFSEINGFIKNYSGYRRELNFSPLIDISSSAVSSLFNCAFSPSILRDVLNLRNKKNYQKLICRSLYLREVDFIQDQSLLNLSNIDIKIIKDEYNIV